MPPPKLNLDCSSITMDIMTDTIPDIQLTPDIQPIYWFRVDLTILQNELFTISTYRMDSCKNIFNTTLKVSSTLGYVLSKATAQITRGDYTPWSVYNDSINTNYSNPRSATLGRLVAEVCSLFLQNNISDLANLTNLADIEDPNPADTNPGTPSKFYNTLVNQIHSLFDNIDIYSKYFENFFENYIKKSTPDEEIPGGLGIYNYKLNGQVIAFINILKVNIGETNLFGAKNPFGNDTPYPLPSTTGWTPASTKKITLINYIDFASKNKSLYGPGGLYENYITIDELGTTTIQIPFKIFISIK